MSRPLILLVLLAAGLPAAGQVPASDPPPSSTTTSSTEQKPQDAAAPSAQKEQEGQGQEKDKEEDKKKKKGALGRLKDHVKDHFSTGCVGAGTAAGCWGDDKDKKDKQGGQQEPGPDKNPAPPRSAENDDPEFSSSRDAQIDLSPPGQEKPPRKKAPTPDDVQELQHYDPHAAEKDIEVGEYYLKRGNLKAALARFRSALHNKPNDALATFRLAHTLEKGGQLAEARESYEKYLQILPKGEFAVECQKALERLPSPSAESAEAAPPASAPAETPRSKH